MAAGIIVLTIFAVSTIAIVVLFTRMYHRDKPSAMSLSARIGKWLSVTFHVKT